jgi:hypothetical protein
MPQTEDGRRFKWAIDSEGRRFRDFTAEVDDRWTVDEATGEIVERRDDDRDRTAYDDEPSPWPEDEGAEEVTRVWSGEILPEDEDELEDGERPRLLHLIDHRAEIRRDKVFESTAGPPRPGAQKPSGPSIGISGPLKAEHRGVRGGKQPPELNASPLDKQPAFLRDRASSCPRGRQR